jgi:hypothetical protein
MHVCILAGYNAPHALASRATEAAAAAEAAALGVGLLSDDAEAVGDAFFEQLLTDSSDVRAKQKCAGEDCYLHILTSTTLQSVSALLMSLAVSCESMYQCKQQ